MFDWMRTDPIGFFRFMLYRAPAVLLALMLHEIAHAYTAYRCGDPTAKLQGRLTLNPLKHLSLIGTLLMFTAGMGWAKPVPVNSSYFRNKRHADLLVSLAGVTVNFLLFALSTLLTILLNECIWSPELFSLNSPYTTRTDFLSFQGENFWQLLYSNEYLLTEIEGAAYYGVPVAEFLRSPLLLHFQRFFYQFALCNLGMCLFNLLPFPPLDGFHVFNDIQLRGKIRLSSQAFRYSMLALLVLMSVTSVLSDLIVKGINLVQGGVLHAFLTLFHLS